MNLVSKAKGPRAEGIEREDLRRGLAALHACSADPPPKDAPARFLALHADFDRLALPLRHALLGSPLAWTDEEEEDGRWLQRTCDDFAALGYRLSACTARQLGLHHERTRAVIASTLFFMGETVKWDVSVTPDAPHDFRKVHALMRLAMDGGHHREAMRMRVDGRDAGCTLESLYFRVLLLARFASGTLNSKQIEVLDAWMWLWMPVLSGVPTPPPGAALRADLDSSGGLQRGPRASPGPSLYLPQEPIEAAYHAVVALFHAGEIVPSEGIASGFRIEEHIAVLDLIRHGLSQSRKGGGARAVRRAANRGVEIHVGLAEIMGKAFAPSAPVAASVALASMPRRTAESRLVRERDVAMGEIYDAPRSLAHLVDESDTGLGLEVADEASGSIAVGDLLAVRFSREEPLVVGKVVRSVAARTAGRVFLGVHRLTAEAKLLDVRLEHALRPGEDAALLYVPGDDSCGRHDACLVSERAFAERARIVAPAGGKDFTLRFNRARDRGRGWVLAGFEVVTARPRHEFEIA